MTHKKDNPAFERTTKGNIHELTTRQHVIPQFAIKPFLNNGTVDVYNLDKQIRQSLTKKDYRFCANRLWDERAEKGFMKSIEDKYENLAKKIIKTPNIEFSREDQSTISDMFFLWRERSYHLHHPQSDYKLNGITPMVPGFSKADIEMLEKKGVITMREDGTHLARQLIGGQIQIRVLSQSSNHKHITWSVYYSPHVEFIFPDTPRGINIMPLTPNLILIVDRPTQFFGHVDRHLATKLNLQMIEASTDYYFARDLSKCFFSALI